MDRSAIFLESLCLPRRSLEVAAGFLFQRLSSDLAMPFAPGQSGNPAGRAPGTKPKAGRWKAAIRRALKEGDNLDACANALETEVMEVEP